MANDPSKTPLQQNPAIPSNLNDPPTLAPAIIGTGVSLAVITNGVVAARLNANFHAARKLGWDDYFCILALLLTVAYTALSISFSRTARHEWDVPRSFLDPPFSQVTYAQTMVYGPSIFFARAAILALYFRVFSPKKTIRVLIYVGVITLLLVYITGLAILTAYCTPRRGGAWDSLLAQHCTPATSINAIVQSVVGIVSDIYILMLPLPVIYKLNLPSKTKAGIFAIFMSGIFALTATSLGLYYRVLNWKGTDRTWAAAKFVLCAFIENNVVIIVSCVPAVAPSWKAFIIRSATFLTPSSLRLSLRPVKRPGDVQSHHRVTGLTARSEDKSLSLELRTRLHNGEYLELSGRAWPEISNTVRAGPVDRSVQGNDITKSVRMDQRSETCL
ncbi:hypothetical protein EV356DRAFT_12643 [Viridothelium virens]|uniref:Rhodopsin domain-containing protein n=1 Tax=Viridothelium virens TaxID=1048519 RepID=A0A6A6HGS2_VIRVR|nr:hypothetical protein EV356DRAFT_12643 [Viridothelium virens]